MVRNARLLDQILAIATSLSIEMIKNGSHPIILNSRKLTGDNYPEDYLVGVLAKQNDTTEDQIVQRMEQLVFNLSRSSEAKLFEKGVNLKA